ncbi:hypothetical protein DP939_22020 [Spongiactinospora rosea]|uniref:ABC transport system permease protein n=1 Tax=Spongiactinospora rosea TaxID=2248750 RepID=A0A366LWB5_9ACTN|nr:hypothetical protein [Spongiactinospora rosea]RBQ18047.1 hypothetical protein DP939_22020 [Spongiactinospora rosea]
MNITLPVRVHRGPAVVLAVLVFTAALLVGGLPRAVQYAYDAALHRSMGGARASAVDLVVNRVPGATADVERLARDDRAWWDLLPPDLRAVTERGPGTRAHHSVRTVETPVSASAKALKNSNRYLNLAWLSDADRRVRYVQGRPPGPTRRTTVPGDPGLGQIPLFEIGLPTHAVRMMGLPVGTTVLLGHSGTVAARVTGVYEAVDPADTYWHHETDLLRATEWPIPGTTATEYHSTALTSAESVRDIDGEHRRLLHQWVLPVRTSAVTARNARQVIDAVAEFGDAVKGVPSYGASATAEPGPTGLLTDYLRRLRTAETLLLLILGGLAVVAVGVIALAVQLLTERMRPALGLMRARGGSLPRVLSIGAGAVALVTVPAGLLGYAASCLVPGAGIPVAHAGPLGITLAAMVIAAGRLVVADRRPPYDGRDDLVTRRISPRRVTLEVIVVAVALGGAYLLRTRGLTTSVPERGADPFLIFVPVALTLAGALIVVRCYPCPLRLIAAVATRGPGAVPFLGLTLAARARSYSALPVLILLPALTVSVFAAVISAGLDATQREAAWLRTGAGARIESTVEIPPEAVRRVRQVPGVRAVVPAMRSQVQIGLGSDFGTGVAIDLAAYRTLLAGSMLTAPEPPPEASAPGGTPLPAVPALVSRDLAGQGGLEVGWNARFTAIPAGTVAALPGLVDRAYRLIVVPYDTNDRAGSRTQPNMLLVSGDDLDADRLAAALRLPAAPTVTTVDGELAKITATPLAGAISQALLVVTVALAAYALLAVLLVLVVTGADRGTALSYLRTLGLSERQARGLTVLEIAPMIVLTAAAGLLLGLVLPSALGPGIDLSVYAGDADVSGHPIDLRTAALLAAGVAAVAVGGAYAYAAVASRRSLGAALRIGD